MMKFTFVAALLVAASALEIESWKISLTKTPTLAFKAGEMATRQRTFPAMQLK